jgi:hypothetical protein
MSKAYTEHGHRFNFFRPHPQPLSYEERGAKEDLKNVKFMPSLSIV